MRRREHEARFKEELRKRRKLKAEEDKRKTEAAKKREEAEVRGKKVEEKEDWEAWEDLKKIDFLRDSWWPPKN
jgi:hypothetical protein